MIDSLYYVSDLAVFAWISMVTIIASFLIIILIHFFLPHHIKTIDNGVIGSIGSLIGIIYGVLAGLIALYLINNNNYAAEIIQREASSVANIYRDSRFIPNPEQAKIQLLVKDYLQLVIKNEWPLMQSGHSVKDNGDILIDQIADQLNAAKISNFSIQRDLLEEIKMLYGARQQRIMMSEARLTTSVWVVIIIGTILTLAINYLFRLEFYLHIVMIAVIGLMVSSMLFLLVTLDRPFQGEFIINPEPYISVSDYINRHS